MTVLSALGILLTLAQAPPPPQAPEQAAAKGVTLTLASASVEPGQAVYVNVMLANQIETRLVELRQTIDFPPDKLTFAGARLGVASDLAGATLTIEMKDRAGKKVEDRAAAARLEIAIAATKQPLEDGPLLELQFRLGDVAPQSIRLTHKAQMLDDLGKMVTDLAFSDGHVVVASDTSPTPAAIMACFFYMH
jgi:hypothetical protein